ncbi:MAG: SDR family oxidoreductase [Chloroflexi bacterium]|nr:SDR family oxidoreductase [Chloroflexota bacterium]
MSPLQPDDGHGEHMTTQPSNSESHGVGRDLSGKVLVVTGGSRGIGRSIVLAAAAKRARVAFCARDIRPAAQVAAEAERFSEPGAVIAMRADITSEDDVEALFDRTLQAFGRVDVVINNAGRLTAGPEAGQGNLILQVPISEWDALLGTNLTGAFLVSRRAVKQFLAQGSGGSIISIGSVAQDGGTGMASYAVSKAGLLGLTKTIAQEYGDKGIRAHIVVAGFLRTDLNKDMPEKQLQALIDWGPQKRAGLVQEIASVALFLASSCSAFINGTAVFVSGGAKDIPAYAAQVK